MGVKGFIKDCFPSGMCPKRDMRCVWEKNLRWIKNQPSKQVESGSTDWPDRLVSMCMVKPGDELPEMVSAFSPWGLLDGSLDWDLPVNSTKRTPVPGCVAKLNSLWERIGVKTVLSFWTLGGYSCWGQDLLCWSEENVPGTNRVLGGHRK